MRYQQHDGAEMTDGALHCTAALVNVTRVTPGRSVAVTARDKLSLSLRGTSRLCSGNCGRGWQRRLGGWGGREAAELIVTRI